MLETIRQYESPAPHGAGGLKLAWVIRAHDSAACPAPHGAGGLKSTVRFHRIGEKPSRPSRGGWVEIRKIVPIERKRHVPPLTGRVG